MAAQRKDPADKGDEQGPFSDDTQRMNPGAEGVWDLDSVPDGALAADSDNHGREPFDVTSGDEDAEDNLEPEETVAADFTDGTVNTVEGFIPADFGVSILNGDGQPQGWTTDEEREWIHDEQMGFKGSDEELQTSMTSSPEPQAWRTNAALDGKLDDAKQHIDSLSGNDPGGELRDFGSGAEADFGVRAPDSATGEDLSQLPSITGQESTRGVEAQGYQTNASGNITESESDQVVIGNNFEEFGSADQTGTEGAEADNVIDSEFDTEHITDFPIE